MKHIFVGLIAFFSLCDVAVPAVKVQLTCQFDSDADGLHRVVFVLTVDQGTADFMSESPSVQCAVAGNESEYEIKCPRTDKRHETWMRANRYTGRMEFEFGSPPFFQQSSGNVYRLGSCLPSGEKKLFYVRAFSRVLGRQFQSAATRAASA